MEQRSREWAGKSFEPDVVLQSGRREALKESKRVKGLRLLQRDVSLILLTTRARAAYLHTPLPLSSVGVQRLCRRV